MIPLAYTTPTPTITATSTPIISTTPTVSIKPSFTPTPTQTLTSTPIPATEAISELTKQLQELKEQIAKYTPEPTLTPKVIYITATPEPTPIPTPTPPPLNIMIIDFPNSHHECKDNERLQGLTQHFEMEYRKPINLEDYQWYSAWAKPTYWYGASGQTTFNQTGLHKVVLTDKWGQKDECWIQTYE